MFKTVRGAAVILRAGTPNRARYSYRIPDDLPGVILARPIPSVSVDSVDPASNQSSRVNSKSSPESRSSSASCVGGRVL
jgi:hypothetical protein